MYFYIFPTNNSKICIFNSTRRGGGRICCTLANKGLNITMCVLSLPKCTQADKDQNTTMCDNGQNNTMCVLSLLKCTQADNGQNNTMCVLSLLKCTQADQK